MKDGDVTEQQPDEIGVSIEVPKLFTKVWREDRSSFWHLLFRRRRWQIGGHDYRGAQIAVIIFVTWPDGSVSARHDTIVGKSESPYVRHIAIRKSSIDLPPEDTSKP